MLLAVDVDEDFIDVEGIAVTSVFPFQPPGVKSTELDAPQADRFSADSYATLSKEILDVSVTQVEAIVEPDGVADDIGRESVSFICVHPPSLPISAR